MVGLARLMAIFMHVISARLGVVTGKDLAQCCRDWHPKTTVDNAARNGRPSYETILLTLDGTPTDRTISVPILKLRAK